MTPGNRQRRRYLGMGISGDLIRYRRGRTSNRGESPLNVVHGVVRLMRAAPFSVHVNRTVA